MDAQQHQAETHNAQAHQAEIVDQFTRQAEPFVQRHAHSQLALLEVMADCAAVCATDTVLDVACGPGIISCFFAGRTHHVTGVDLVPAMLERAAKLAAEQNVENVTWKLGSCADLPFSAASFDCVVTRFSFHHFLDPLTALGEMKRVAKAGGAILVCDVAPTREAQEEFNNWEMLRDPSHTRALTESEFERFGQKTGLELQRKSNYTLTMDLDDLLSGSFPRPGNAAKIRTLFEEEIAAGTDRFGVAAQGLGDRIQIAYPVALLVWRKPAEL